ncbi:sodium-dependent phosphate transport protein 2A-like [Gigantopelta aegis]|uniref:sodium-dependent phosphate transport protein 2A-like n=1 Tax=Gigantopelta aegis TaxID=1735272 RepID=UPI001B88B72B|nr:sodium-dependent phosphate transport protein 2A-like [Gigantopelta aegis]
MTVLSEYLEKLEGKWNGEDLETGTRGLSGLTNAHGNLEPQNGNLPNPDSGFSSVVSLQSDGGTSEVTKYDLSQSDLSKWPQSVLTPVLEDGSGDKKSAIPSQSAAWCGKAKVAVKILGIFVILYFFICSLDFLSKAFKLLGGKAAGGVFSQSELLQNPITGLMIGVLATVLLQSSSTSTSIIITMVSSGILTVQPAIPIIMGANIGTTVTNTIVSLAHSGKGREFKRAFSGATVHDVFNWLTVLVLLPLEVATGMLHKLTSAIVGSCDFSALKGKKQDLLKTLTKPLTNLIIKMDDNVISKIAEGDEEYLNKRLVKVICKYDEVVVQRNTSVVDVNDGVTVAASAVNTTAIADTTSHGSFYQVENITLRINNQTCDSLFSHVDVSDTVAGILLLVFSIALLTGCLIVLVRLLHSMLQSRITRTLKRTINARLPGPFACLTGYLVILVGAGLTMLVQSSSVFTSTLTPLVGVGCLKLRRMYPLTLGSNIGTTATGILAALAAPASTIDVALQIALCHLFFNIFGIMLFYPIPCLRRIPIRAAICLGKTTAKYRWFAVVYLLCMFFIIPGAFFALSLAGRIPFLTTTAAVGVVAVFVVVINVMQSKCKNRLPGFLKTWNWLPKCLRSLEPMDKVGKKLMEVFGKCCPCKKCGPQEEVSDDDTEVSESEVTVEEEDADEMDDECGALSNVLFCCCRAKSKDARKSDDEGFVEESEKTDLMSKSKHSGGGDDDVNFQPQQNKIFKGVLTNPWSPLRTAHQQSHDCVGPKRTLGYQGQESSSQAPLLYVVSVV